MKRDFLSIADFETGELYELLQLARALKSGDAVDRPLRARALP